MGHLLPRGMRRMGTTLGALGDDDHSPLMYCDVFSVWSFSLL